MRTVNIWSWLWLAGSFVVCGVMVTRLVATQKDVRALEAYFDRIPDVVTEIIIVDDTPDGTVTRRGE